MKIYIDYVAAENKIRITPQDFDFGKLRGVNSYIKLIGGKVISPDLIEVPLNDADINEVYAKLNKIFLNEFSCEIVSEISAQKIFTEAEQEAENFAVFSKKAEDIRNNNISSDEFLSFCDVLADTEFKRSLKPYQLLAAYHVAFSQNACNFSVPGSGKTSTVLAAYEYLRKCDNVDKKVEKIVVIGPLSSFIAWKLEYKACFGYEPDSIEIRGGVNKTYLERQLLSSSPKCELLIISYGSVASNYELIAYFLKHNRCMVVLDEAHRIKKVGEEAQSNYVLSLASLARSRVVLTGTPAANSYVDLYNLYKFIWPHNNVIGYSVPQLASMSRNVNDGRVEDLMDRISPFFIRVKKSHLGLPEPVFHEPDIIEMSPVQSEIYEAIEKVVINKWASNGLPENIRKAAAIRLRQAASNPGLLLKSLESDVVYDEDEPVGDRGIDDIELDKNLISKIISYKSMEVPNKFKEALNIANSLLEKGEKAIIWCEFIGTCDDLSDYLKKNGIDNRILYGKCPQEEREAIIKEFLDESINSFKVIVANPHAVGESISLHTTCHNAIYLEQGFNAGVYMQSKDRIHRVGLKETDVVSYYFIQSKYSVDSVVYDRVMEKERRMLELIESQEIPLLAANLDFEEDSEADIKAIIKDYYDRRNRRV